MQNYARIWIWNKPLGLPGRWELFAARAFEGPKPGEHLICVETPASRLMPEVLVGDRAFWSSPPFKWFELWELKIWEQTPKWDLCYDFGNW